MKAGIYKTRDSGKLMYVAKDRSIRAFELPAPPAGDTKVTTSQKEQVVTWTCGTTGDIADRVCDVPNGCTDSVTFLNNVRRVLDTGRVIVAVNGIDDFVTEPDGLREYQTAARDLVGKVYASLPKGAGKSGGTVDHKLAADHFHDTVEITQPLDEITRRALLSPPMPEEGLPNKQTLTYAEAIRDVDWAPLTEDQIIGLFQTPPVVPVRPWDRKLYTKDGPTSTVRLTAGQLDAQIERAGQRELEMHDMAVAAARSGIVTVTGDEIFVHDGERWHEFQKAWVRRGPAKLFDEEMKTGDIVIEFADNGQDFLRWLCREDEQGFTRVIDCQPYQGFVWNGTIVHNAENLTLGRGARLANVTTQSMTAPDAMQMSHDVIAARRVGQGSVVTDADWAPLTEEQVIGQLQTARAEGRRPPMLAVRCGSESLLRSAQAIREAGVGVPPHIARKLIDEYRAAAYKPLPGAADFSEPEDRTEEMPIDRLMRALRTQNVDIVNQFAYAEHELQILLEGERRGCLKLMAGGEVNVLDLDAYEELRANPPPVLPVLPKGTVRQYIDGGVSVKPKLKDTAVARDINHVFVSGNVDAIPNDGRRYAVVYPMVYPITGRPLHPQLKARGVIALVACTTREKARLFEALELLKTGAIRLCGAKSKRKHRKAGHAVYWCEALQSWAWEVKP